MSKLTIIATVAVVAVVAAVGVEKAIEAPKAKVTLRALDEKGAPLQGAEAKMSFDQAILKWGGGEKVPVAGKTDERGEFTGEGHSDGSQGGLIQKEGYYASWAKSVEFKRHSAGKWQPWNPTLDVVLKKIINPIPMYARKVGFDVKRVEIPSIGGPYGFDLVESDWLAPHGQGKASDFRFALERRFISYEDYDAKVSITFSNPGDGLRVIELPEIVSSISELKLPREAPEDGYTLELKTRIGNTPAGAPYQDARDNRSYFFRVRTVLDEKGKVVSALYGKIDSHFQIDPINSKTARLLFTYYLNPTTNDRNLEFDPKRNLFTNLPDSEKVRTRKAPTPALV